MKKLVVSIVLSTVILATSTFAGGEDPGSKADPLVTKSYVDAQLAKIQGSGSSQGLQEQLNTQKELINLLLEQVSALQMQIDGDKAGGYTYELVNVPAGKHFVGEQSTEFILRSGKGIVMGSANGGLQDVTSGEDVADGVQVPKNHLLIVPRADGRGLQAESDVIIMVRGGYTVY